jgi:hypothetical protein
MSTKLVCLDKAGDVSTNDPLFLRLKFPARIAHFSLRCQGSYAFVSCFDVYWRRFASLLAGERSDIQ